MLPLTRPEIPDPFRIESGGAVYLGNASDTGGLLLLARERVVLPFAVVKSISGKRPAT